MDKYEATICGCDNPTLIAYDQSCGAGNVAKPDEVMKRAYEVLVKDLPEDQREGVIAQIARQARRVVARSRGQSQNRAEGVSV